MVWLFLTCKCNKQKSLNFRNFIKLFLCNIQSIETCSLRDQDSQIWVSRLHHWFRHRCTLLLLQRILVSSLHGGSDGVSRCGLGLETSHFSSLNLEGLRSCLGLQKYGLVKFGKSTCFWSAVFVDKKQPTQVR